MDRLNTLYEAYQNQPSKKQRMICNNNTDAEYLSLLNKVLPNTQGGYLCTNRVHNGTQYIYIRGSTCICRRMCTSTQEITMRICAPLRQSKACVVAGRGSLEAIFMDRTHARYKEVVPHNVTKMLFTCYFPFGNKAVQPEMGLSASHVQSNKVARTLSRTHDHFFDQLITQQVGLVVS